MAALPENNTARYRLHYTSGGNQHSMQIRSGTSPAFFGGMMNDFLTALGSAVYTITVDFVEWSAALSNVFNNVTTGIETNTYGAGIPVAENRAYALNFIGRTAGGRRVRLMVFSPTVLTADYRYIRGEGASIDAARDVLVNAGSQITGIDGLVPIWKTYVNTLSNAYWQKELRP
jgi:hypothetical protein